MRLQELILNSIKTENFDRKSNVFSVDAEEDVRYKTFPDIDINIEGQKWESYISFDLEIEYRYIDYNETPPADDFEVLSVELEKLEIVVDGLRVSDEDFVDKVTEKIKELIEIEM